MSIRLADADPLEINRFDVGDILHARQGMSYPYFFASKKVCGSLNDSEARSRHNVCMERIYLREWRKFRHLTLEEVADAVGSTKATIQQLEVGRISLSHKWLVRLAPVLGTTPGMLIDHDPNELPTSVLETWAAIPDDRKAQAVAVLETFKRTGTEG